MRKSQRGDTIIEVLLAIAVVSSVLGISYSIMNRNILTLRSNQERTEAAKIAQAQLETLKYTWNTNPAAIGAGGFCFSGGAHRPLGGTAPTASISDDIYTNYSAAGCRFNNLYHAGIRRTATDTYTVYVRWDQVGGRQGASDARFARNEVVMVYRLR